MNRSSTCVEQLFCAKFCITFYPLLIQHPKATGGLVRMEYLNNLQKRQSKCTALKIKQAFAMKLLIIILTTILRKFDLFTNA